MADINELINAFTQELAQLRGPTLEQSGFRLSPTARTVEEGLRFAPKSTQDEFKRAREEVKRLEGETRKRVLSFAEQDALTAARGKVQELTTQFQTGLEKTPERLAEEARLQRVRDIEGQTLEAQLGLFQQQLQDIEAQRPALLQAQEQAGLISQAAGEQIQRALAGEIPASAALERQKQEQFEQLKEREGRRGNIILGATPEEATAKGTAAQQSLSRFRERFGILEQQERQAIIGQQLPLFQAGLGQLTGMGQLGFQAGPQPGAITATAPGISGLLPSALTGQALTTIAPIQQQQRMLELQAAQIEEAREASRRRGKSALLGAGIGAFGSLAGGALTGLLSPAPVQNVLKLT